VVEGSHKIYARGKKAILLSSYTSSVKLILGTEVKTMVASWLAITSSLAWSMGKANEKIFSPFLNLCCEMFGILFANFLNIRVENYASPNLHYTTFVALPVNEQNCDYDLRPFLLLDMLDVFYSRDP
jgi:hypothetical protein